jgi:cellulose synthase/poly-beta-1,6-N-acetylglucosamine synthase-like glycosyltransferase
LITVVLVTVLLTTSVLLLVFGVNLVYLSLSATRSKPRALLAIVDRDEPRVCVQVPIYNERYVAERVLDAVCAIDWPLDRFEVQVLDDSDDETVGIVARRVARCRRRGVQVSHVRRGTRDGFKAGALAYGLEQTDAPLIAIFDADFVPPPDFLRRMVRAFDDQSVGFAQARWGHLDEGYSFFTRLQAMAIDFHFLIEQAVRTDRGYFTNFTGTAGVWRREAIVQSGGWSSRTLTEDLDLSYRAQLRGWKAAYVEDVVVPEELPVSVEAYRRQQSRWATGSFQSAFRLLVPVLRSDNRKAVKFQAAVHLLAYGVGPLMLIQLLCYPALILTGAPYGIPWQPSYASMTLVVVAGAPTFGFIVAQTKRGRRWWTGLPSVLCQIVGAGMSLNTMIALGRAVKPGGVFVRTPKHHIVRPGQEWMDQDYVRAGDWRAALEAIFGLVVLAIVPVALAHKQGILAAYAGIFALGFLVVSGLTIVEFVEVMALRRLGRRTLRHALALAPAAVLLGFAGALLLVAAQMPEPFEDGYGHWLIAANLASTGHLHDPLFGMEDTWLPGYHLLAAAILRTFGLWQIGALKALGAMLGLATAACVYALAPNPRQARLAVVLLVLNPVFLFTSGSAVVEPLVTALLMSAALAAARSRMKLAALFAVLACATSTKAWIWIGAAAAFALAETVRSRKRIPAVAWAVPALALLVFLQLGFAPASHSVTRGTVEVMSATARGSLPAGGLARLTELVATYGLATLPLLGFAVPGLMVAARRHAAPLWRFVYLPAIVYTAAIGGLVGLGVYSGSHRYLYPALPALALIAAAALDRHGVARLATIAASAILAVGFLPVFWSFAADNAGLIAAGRVSSGTPGVLLTDSPVAAYYSGKPPSMVTGSQALPLERGQALTWMRSHDVNVVVLENISYYRAASVFPDLASGLATVPFTALGGNYNVSGGKNVYAYRLLTALQLGSVAQGQAAGKTAPLAKGVTIGASGTGEGMGFGVPIAHYPDGWVYARSASDTDLSTPGKTIWRRTFQLDEIGGDAAHSYRFVPISSRGAIEVTYALDTKGLTIAVRALWLAPGYTEVGVLNEQSSAFDDFAADGQPALIGPAFGSWIPVSGRWARLRSGSIGLEFSVPAVAGASLFGGREHQPPDFDWAGLDYMFAGSFSGATYHINLEAAR